MVCGSGTLTPPRTIQRVSALRGWLALWGRGVHPPRRVSCSSTCFVLSGAFLASLRVPITRRDAFKASYGLGTWRTRVYSTGRRVSRSIMLAIRSPATRTCVSRFSSVHAIELIPRPGQDVVSGSSQQCNVLVSHLEVDDLVRASLNAHFAQPDLFNDQWELEPLTPLPSPYQSPTLSSADTGPLPDFPTLNDVSQLPVIHPSLPTTTNPSASCSSVLAATLPRQTERTHAKAGKTKRRAKRRKAAATPFDRKVKSSTSESVAGTGMLKTTAKAESLHIARGAYNGRRQDRVEQKYWTMERLLAAGFDIQKWDGRCVVLILLRSHYPEPGA